MKTLFIFLIVYFSITVNLLTQPVAGQTIATKVLFYNSGGLFGESSEVYGPLSDSTTRVGSSGMRHTVCFDGTFYQVASSQKYQTGIEKIVFRKSTDGIVWSDIIRANDAAPGVTEADPQVHVWKKNNNIHVGVSFYDFRVTPPQMRFSLSTNGGTSFQPSVQIGNNPTSHNYFYNCGFTGTGDTIVITWTYVISNNNGPTFYAITTNGGVSWLPMGTAHPGSIRSKYADAMISQNQTIYSATSHFNGSGKNIEIRSTTNLGTNWIVNTSITSQSGNNANDHVHLSRFNNTFYSVWLHHFHETGFYDRLYFSKSTNSGTSWQAPVRINDNDTLINSSGFDAGIFGHPTLAFSPSGRIYAVWADSRERQRSLYDSAWFHVYIARSNDDGNTWSPDYKVSGPSNISMVANWYPCVNIKSNGTIDTVLISWSKVRDVNIPAPPAPNLVSPANNSNGQSVTPLLDWDSASTASNYRIQISTNSAFTNIQFDTTGVAATQVTIPAGKLTNNVNYFWRVYGANGSGPGPWSVVWNFTTALVGITQNGNEIPASFKLYNNYPNPFNPVTKIKFDLPEQSYTRLVVYDLLGKEVKTLVNMQLQSGSYTADLNADGLSSGIYFYRIETGKFTDIKKMILVK